MSTIILVVVLIGVGVVLAGYVYHRWSKQTQTVVDSVANTVNSVIDKTK